VAIFPFQSFADSSLKRHCWETCAMHAEPH